MKNKFKINGAPVPVLKDWCEDKKLVYSSFLKAIRRAKKGVKNEDGTWKKSPSNECHYRGYFIIRL